LLITRTGDIVGEVAKGGWVGEVLFDRIRVINGGASRAERLELLDNARRECRHWLGLGALHAFGEEAG